MSRLDLAAAKGDARIVGSGRRLPIGVGIFAGALILMGLLHFISPRPFDSIVPRLFPAATRRPLTYLSGVAEIVCGALMLAPRTRRLGGRLTAALMLAVWPANIDAALRGGYPGLSGVAGSPLGAWLRVPLQLPLIWFAWRIGRTPTMKGPTPPPGSTASTEERS